MSPVCKHRETLCVTAGGNRVRLDRQCVLCRGASSGSIKSLPASVRQPLGFRTMYNSMHGEQIELQQAYAGALSGGAVPAAAARPSTAACASSCASSVVRTPQHIHSQVHVLFVSCTRDNTHTCTKVQMDCRFTGALCISCYLTRRAVHKLASSQ